MKRTALLILLLLLPVAVADSSTADLHTRLSVVEDRLRRAENDLRSLPTLTNTVVRIEGKLNELAARSDKGENWAATIVISILTMGAGATAGAAWRNKHPGA